ncbi:hypothetical protein [Cohnella thermotolerans]|uniref:hypothetical protein n=1 Tax=Cohnella thermotolerans TaxID=329858 RepID=UPI0004108458|nr:hypothetical protein [Cohnella thermotolerans]
MMSQAVFELTKQQVEIGYKKKDEQILEKETDYIFSKIVTTILSLFPDKIKGIQFDRQSLALTNEILFSEKHKKNLFKWLNRLIHLDSPCSDLEFGKLKIDFEHWYYELSGEHIEFIYEDSYLGLAEQDQFKLLPTHEPRP